MSADLRIVRGTPTDEEVAALVAVLLRRLRREDSSGRFAAPTRWRESTRPGAIYADGRPTRPGAHGWRLSARPH